MEEIYTFPDTKMETMNGCPSLYLVVIVKSNLNLVFLKPSLVAEVICKDINWKQGNVVNSKTTISHKTVTLAPHKAIQYKSPRVYVGIPDSLH